MLSFLLNASFHEDDDHDHDQSELIPNGWLIGVALGVTASIISNLGLNLQKKSHMKIAALAEAEKRATEHGMENPPVLSPYDAIRDNLPLDVDSAYEPLDDPLPHPLPISNGYNTFKDEEDDESSEYDESESDSGMESDAEDPTLIQDLTAQVASRSHIATSSSYSAATHPIHLSAPTDRRLDAKLTMNSSSMSSRISSSSFNHTSHHTPHTPRHKKKSTKNYTRYRMWQVGITCVVLGSLLDFAALAFAAQSIIAPLGSLTLVSNVIVAPILLKEQVTRRDIICTIAIVVGSVLSVAFASHGDVNYTIEEMFEFFETIPFLIYVGVVCIGMIILRYGLYRVEQLKANGPSSQYLQYLGFHCFAYAALAGIMGAQSVLMAKCTSQLFLLTVSATGQIMFAFWQSYFILGGLGISILFQIRWLNAGLASFDALSIVPIFQSFWILVSVVGGMVFFHEYHAVFKSVLNGIMFPTGLAMTIAGVYVLSQKNRDTSSATASSRTPLLHEHITTDTTIIRPPTTIAISYYDTSRTQTPVARSRMNVSFAPTTPPPTHKIVTNGQTVQSQSPSQTQTQTQSQQQIQPQTHLQPPTPQTPQTPPTRQTQPQTPPQTPPQVQTQTQSQPPQSAPEPQSQSQSITSPVPPLSIPTQSRKSLTSLSTRIDIPTPKRQPRYHAHTHRERRRSPGANNNILTPLIAVFLPPPTAVRRGRSHTHTSRYHIAETHQHAEISTPTPQPQVDENEISPTPASPSLPASDTPSESTASKSAPEVTSPLIDTTPLTDTTPPTDLV